MRDPRAGNFIQAYLDMGLSREEAAERGVQRAREDRDALFVLEACTNFSTAKATVWLLEAASMLCCGSLGNKEAIRLIEMASKSLQHASRLLELKGEVK